MADVITDLGRQHIAGLLAKTIASPAGYFGNVGTGAGTAAIGQTGLFTEVGTARIATTLSVQTTGSPASNTARNVFTYTATGATSVTNAGVFTASTGATLIQQSDHASIPLLATDSIAYTFDDRVV